MCVERGAAGINPTVVPSQRWRSVTAPPVVAGLCVKRRLSAGVSAMRTQSVRISVSLVWRASAPGICYSSLILTAPCAVKASGEIAHAAKMTIYIWVEKPVCFYLEVAVEHISLFSTRSNFPKDFFQKSLSNWDLILFFINLKYWQFFRKSLNETCEIQWQHFKEKVDLWIVKLRMFICQSGRGGLRLRWVWCFGLSLVKRFHVKKTHRQKVKYWLWSSSYAGQDEHAFSPHRISDVFPGSERISLFHRAALPNASDHLWSFSKQQQIRFFSSLWMNELCGSLPSAADHSPPL